MIYFDTFLYYTIFASIVLIYGIGVNRLTEIGTQKLGHITFYLKTLISVFATIVLSTLVVRFILLPIGLIELYPLLALLIYVSLNTFLEALVRLTTGTSTTEFVISFLIILLALSESTSILDSIIIGASCFASIILVVPFIYTLKRNLMTNGSKFEEKHYTFFFLFLGLLIIVLSVLDITWLNPGVVK